MFTEEDEYFDDEEMEDEEVYDDDQDESQAENEDKEIYFMSTQSQARKSSTQIVQDLYSETGLIRDNLCIIH